MIKSAFLLKEMAVASSLKREILSKSFKLFFVQLNVLESISHENISLKKG
jgi:hypothetical protein